MHYYPHHIGDFIKDTANLNNDQCMAYLRMCWRYYLDEKPIIGECEDIAFALGTDEKTVRLLLKHYFIESEEGWRHSRIDREIDAYKNKAEKARKSANARWNNANAMRTHSERNADASKNDANQEPRTKNQERKEKKEKKLYSKEFETAWKAYPKREGGNPKNSAFKAWNARIRDGVTPEDMTEGIARYARYLKVKDMIGTQWVKQASVFFGPDKHYAEQWEVATPKPKRNGSGTAEDVGRAYEAEFGKPPPPGKTTDEVRAMISQRREKTATWLSG